MITFLYLTYGILYLVEYLQINTTKVIIGISLLIIYKILQFVYELVLEE